MFVFSSSLSELAPARTAEVCEAQGYLAVHNTMAGQVSSSLEFFFFFNLEKEWVRKFSFFLASLLLYWLWSGRSAFCGWKRLAQSLSYGDVCLAFCCCGILTATLSYLQRWENVCVWGGGGGGERGMCARACVCVCV